MHDFCVTLTLSMAELTATQLQKAEKLLLLFEKHKTKAAATKPLLSLRGVLKGVKVSEKDIKAARASLFRR